MKYYILTFLLSCVMLTGTAQTKKRVDSFNKVIISPHIEAVLVQGDEPSVTIKECKVPEDKVNIEVKGNTLRVYLDDAKELTKREKVKRNRMKRKLPVYKGKVLTVTIVYRDLKALSVRGEQTILCESPITSEKFKLNLYGESIMIFNKVMFTDFDVDIYGESTLTVKEGNVHFQKVTSYGEGEVNLLSVNNKTTKLIAYGEADFNIQASERIKFTAYGEAKLHYKGNPVVKKGLSFGKSRISKID